MLGVRPTFPCGGRTCRGRGRRRPGRCRWRCGGRSRERRKHRSGRQFSERPENMPRKPAFALIHTKPALPASIHSGHVHIIGSLQGGVFRRFREHYYITGLTPFRPGKRSLPTPHPLRGAAEGAARLRRAPFFPAPRSARSTVLKGRRVLRSTAPENSPKTPENSPKSEFSTPWKKFFHCVEKSPKVFPLCGKNGPFFPQCGKYFSIAWKNREKVFHTVENLGPSDGFRLAFGRVALLDSKLF